METQLAPPEIDVDLSTFVLEEAEATSGCEMIIPRCSREALYRVKWGPDLRQGPEHQCRCQRVTLCCLMCYDGAVSRLQGDSIMTCAKCGLCMVPTSVEKTRGTR